VHRWNRRADHRREASHSSPHRDAACATALRRSGVCKPAAMRSDPSSGGSVADQ
jgi:hypothetical protein